MDQRERIEVVRKRLRDMQVDERRAKTAGPPCVECIHVLKDRQAPACGHLVYAKRSFVVATGETSEESTTPASWARADDGLCGPEALLFEPVPILKKLLNYFRSDHHLTRRYSSSVMGGP